MQQNRQADAKEPENLDGGRAAMERREVSGARTLRARGKTAAIRIVLASGAAAALIGSGWAAQSMAPAARPFFPPLERAPLDGALALTGNFGNSRSNHFHAGFDLETGGRVGKPVFAPLPGHIERVRASGIGYGRSVYLKADDGRLLVFGHLDAFDEPLASYVAAVQESTGQYEQDLWPDASRFPAHTGQRIAWSGESGGGGPHLHFEIRRGDMAMNPLRGGLSVPDTVAPRIMGVTFEPLDDASMVEGGCGPFRVTWPSGRDTVTLALDGRVRAIVHAMDAARAGRYELAPWSTSLEADGVQVDCRFDSVSWATDMSEIDFVYDRGRATESGNESLVLWSPAGSTPRVLAANAPGRSPELGALSIRRGDPPRLAHLVVQDVAGNRAERWVRLVATDSPVPPDPDRPEAGARQVGVTFRVQPLADYRSRIELAGTPPRSDLVRVKMRESWHPATRGERGWSAITPELSRSTTVSLEAVGRSGGKEWHSRPVSFSVTPVTAGASAAYGRRHGFQWGVPEGGVFGHVAIWQQELGGPAPTAELEPLGEAHALLPAMLPLHRPISVSIALPRAASPSRAGLYRLSEDGWEYVGATYDSAARAIGSDSRRLGRFALFSDRRAPRIHLVRSARRPAVGPYSRWALEARLDEGGSGVDPSRSFFRVDGKRMPSEWDSEEHTLRWRPLHAPRRGAHRFEAQVADRAGNSSRVSGSFVID